jgi:large subunit ribosomal protein L24
VAIRKRNPAEPVKTRIRKDDMVQVISGRDRGKTGRVLSVNRTKGTAVVEGVMMVKRHTKPNPSQQIKGGIAEREGPIALSNIMVLASDGRPTRISYRVEGTGVSARRVRVARRTGEPLDKSAK